MIASTDSRASQRKAVLNRSTCVTAIYPPPALVSSSWAFLASTGLFSTSKTFMCDPGHAVIARSLKWDEEKHRLRTARDQSLLIGLPDCNGR